MSAEVSNSNFLYSCWSDLPLKRRIALSCDILLLLSDLMTSDSCHFFCLYDLLLIANARLWNVLRLHASEQTPRLWSKWVGKCFHFSCFRVRSPSGQSDGRAVCVGDGVAAEHGPGQELHLALFRERPAAGDISHRSLGFRTSVSFNSPPSCFAFLICRWLGPRREPG